MMTYQRALVVFILLLGFALRIGGVVGESPPGVAHDEVANWLIDRAILDDGNHAVYFTRAYGHEAGFHYIQAASIALLGDNLLALRLPAVFGGLLGVAVTFTLIRRLFDIRVALLAAGLLAVLFWPVFYGRLGLRAIWLPLVSGLSAYFWWDGWGVARGKLQMTSGRFVLSGFLAGLSLYIYLAARALPVFYGVFILYLLLFQREAIKQRGRGVLVFTAVFFLTTLPLIVYLQTTPEAETRVAEVSLPLTALLAGDVVPVLTNGLKLAGMFGFVGDPLWREGVPTAPVFEPLLAVLFYGGVLLSLWHWRDGRYAFLLLWLLLSLLPSLVTINAPSHIRSINALAVMTTFPAIVIHKIFELSTVFPKLSTKSVKLALTIFIFTFFSLYAGRTINLMLNVWPNSGDIPFVWQTAFAEVAHLLDEKTTRHEERELAGVALAGWSPETMDSPSLALLRQHEEIGISYFNPQEGTLILPMGNQIMRPTELPLDPFWEEQLVQWGAAVSQGQFVTQYVMPRRLDVAPLFPADTTFGETILFLGYDLDCPVSHGCHLITYWRVTAVPPEAQRLFIHFLDESGEQLADVYAFDSADPQALWFPHWQVGDLILQRHKLPLAQANIAHIRLGWFDPYSCTPGPCQNLRTETGANHVLLPAR